jgi:hypothetical protein
VRRPPARLLAARIVLALIGITVGVGGVMALREATLSTHHRMSPDSKAILVFDAWTRNAEKDQTVAESAEALLLACRLQVGRSDVHRITQLSEHRFEAELRRGLDRTNRRQLQGCLEDWTLDYVRMDVRSLVNVG